MVGPLRTSAYSSGSLFANESVQKNFIVPFISFMEKYTAMVRSAGYGTLDFFAVAFGSWCEPQGFNATSDCDIQIFVSARCFSFLQSSPTFKELKTDARKIEKQAMDILQRPVTIFISEYAIEEGIPMVNTEASFNAMNLDGFKGLLKTWAFMTITNPYRSVVLSGDARDISTIATMQNAVAAIPVKEGYQLFVYAHKFYVLWLIKHRKANQAKIAKVFLRCVSSYLILGGANARDTPNKFEFIRENYWIIKKVNVKLFSKEENIDAIIRKAIEIRYGGQWNLTEQDLEQIQRFFLFVKKEYKKSVGVFGKVGIEWDWHTAVYSAIFMNRIQKLRNKEVKENWVQELIETENIVEHLSEFLLFVYRRLDKEFSFTIIQDLEKQKIEQYNASNNAQQTIQELVALIKVEIEKTKQRLEKEIDFIVDAARITKATRKELSGIEQTVEKQQADAGEALQIIANLEQLTRNFIELIRLLKRLINEELHPELRFIEQVSRMEEEQAKQKIKEGIPRLKREHSVLTEISTLTEATKMLMRTLQRELKEELHALQQTEERFKTKEVGQQLQHA